MATNHENTQDYGESRLDLIKKRHQKVILNSDDMLIDEDEVFDNYEEQREMEYIENYASGM